MKRVVVTIVAMGLGAASWAQQAPPPQLPVFRSRVDLRQLDVTILDKNRRPVSGLTADDFSVTEDGVVQKIEAFKFVEVQNGVAREEPKWSAGATADVVTNDFDSARVFVLVVDDVGGMGDLWAKNQVPKSVATFVNQMGPDDLAALVFTGRGDRSVNFTRDKSKLIKAVDWYTSVNETVGPCGATPITLRYVAENLASMKNRRKSIVIFAGGLKFDPSPNNPCGAGYLWEQVVRIARENNIAFYPVDTMGLRPWRPGSIASASNGEIVDNWISLANHTGGHALINSNSFTEGLTKIYEENASYYLLAYQPTNTKEDGRFRRVIVKVNRPDVEVSSTRSYWAPRPASPSRPEPSPPPPEAEALAGVLPWAQMPLRATAAAFRSEGSGAVVAVAIDVTQPAFLERTRETVDLFIRTLTPDGIDHGSDRHTIAVTVPASPAGRETSSYEVLARVDVPGPGRYELRFAAHSESTGRRASIYVDVDVPDFRLDKLALSGVVLNNAFSPAPVAPSRLLREVTPIVPTTARAFGTNDIVTAFLRAYQGGPENLAPVTMRVHILDAAGKAVLDKSETLAVERFSTERSAEYQFRLPLPTLAIGEYLLTFEATVDKTTVRRDVRFQVR